MSKDSIAIITANKNNASRIPDYFAGILSQTVKPNYVVIVDDGSTDNSVEVILSELNKLPKHSKLACLSVPNRIDDIFSCSYNGTIFTLLTRKNSMGPAASRNDAINFIKKKAHILAIHDSDDMYYPKKLERSLDILNKFPNVALVYSDYNTVNITSGDKKREFKEPFSYKRLLEECIVSNNSIIATSVLEKSGMYDETLFGPEDYDLWLRIAENSAVYHIPEALYQYTITGNNITITTPSPRFQEQVIRVKQKAYQRHQQQ